MIDISRRQWFAINCAMQCIAIEAIMTFTIGFDTFTIEVFIIGVLRFLADITTLLNTSIVKGSKHIVEVSSYLCCFNSNTFILQHQYIELSQLIVNHYLHEILIKVLGMLPLKSAVQSVDFSGGFWLIWYSTKRAYVIMICPSCIVVIRHRRRHHQHLCTAPLATGFRIETSYLV